MELNCTPAAWSGALPISRIVYTSSGRSLRRAAFLACKTKTSSSCILLNGDRDCPPRGDRGLRLLPRYCRLCPGCTRDRPRARWSLLEVGGGTKCWAFWSFGISPTHFRQEPFDPLARSSLYGPTVFPGSGLFQPEHGDYSRPSWLAGLSSVSLPW